MEVVPGIQRDDIWSTINAGLTQYFDYKKFEREADVAAALRAFDQRTPDGTDGVTYAGGASSGGVSIGSMPAWFPWAITAGGVVLVGLVLLRK